MFLLDIHFRQGVTRVRNYEFSRDIVIILIDEASSEAMNLPLESRWSAYHPELIRKLNNAGASLIAFDIQFGREEDQHNIVLAESFKEAGNVLAGEIIPGKTVPLIRDSLLGIGSFLVKPYGGAPRMVPDYPARGLPAFSVLVARKYRPMEFAGSFWINFSYPRNYFPLFSYSTVLNSGPERLRDNAGTPLSVFKNKIVLIAKNYDRYPFPPAPDILTPGVVGQAYAVQSILDGSVLRTPPWWVEFLLLIFLGGGVFFWVLFVRRIPSPLWLLLGLIILFFLRGFFFFRFHLWLNISPFVIALPSFFFLLRRGRQGVVRKNLAYLEGEVKKLEALQEGFTRKEALENIFKETLVHDIKNSVAAIEGSIHFLKIKYKEDPLTLRNLKASFTACNDILSLSSNLIDLSRLEAEELTPELSYCPFPVFREIIINYLNHPVILDKNIRTSVVDPGDEMPVQADAYLLKRVIHNLLDNASRYTPPGGEIRISVAAEGDFIVYRFYNTGPVVSEKQKEMIFEKYVRLEQMRSKYAKGLGLYFCRLVMQAHNGTILLETDQEGNAFQLRFPMARLDILRKPAVL